MSNKNILIIGGGASGLSAACCAATLGGNVTILEKNPNPGGNGIMAEVMFAAGSKEQKKRGIEIDIDDYYNAIMEHAHYKCNGRLIRALLEESHNTMDFLTENGLHIAEIIKGFENDIACSTHTTEGYHTGREVIKVLRAFCSDNANINIITDTVATEIIMENDCVKGVKAKQSGNDVEFEADSVIIATGGFSGNKELAKTITGIDLDDFGHLRGLLTMGEGIMMAKKAGAEIMDDGCLENAGPVYMGDQTIMSLVTKRYAIWLNSSAKRFANEAIGDNFVYGCNAVYAQPGHKCFVLLDEKMINKVLDEPVHMLAGPTAVSKGTKDLYEVIDKEAKRGDLCISSDLSEIAKWMNVNVDDLKKEIDEYNEFCKNGRDPVFLKPTELLESIEGGKYLAIRCGVDFVITHGGIRVNENMQVQRPDGSVIKGLFASGVDISGVDSNGYMVASMGGHSFGFSCTGGRLAAKSALK